MKFYFSTFSRAVMALLLFTTLSTFPHFGYAQKILSEMETHYVLEAQQELNAALSDPTMNQAERMRVVERSAKTLKEYGQPPAFPKGSTPLKELMQSNFDLARDQYNDVNDLRRVVNNMNHGARMKFINQLQIEVVEEQVKFLLPGYTPFTLAQSLVNTNLDINIADGVNRGDVDDARTLVRLFKEIAEANKLAGMLDKLFNDHRFTSENLHRDLQMVEPLEAQLRKRYELAAAGTQIIRGYEGAMLAGNSVEQNQSAIATPGSATGNQSSPLVGAWLYIDPDNTNSRMGWTFNSNGTAVEIIDERSFQGWTWQVSGSTLFITGGNNERNNYEYRIDNNALFLKVEWDGEQIWSVPMKRQ